jgi:hypothetical protein
MKKEITKKINSAEKYKNDNHHFKNVKVKRGINGLGLFAGENIKKGETIIEYIGEIISDEESDKKPNNRYYFYISKNHTIDGSARYNIARYANHSCDGNAESEIKNKRIYFKAIKNIASGEEICYDYGEEYFNQYLKDVCACNAKKHLYN